MQIASLRDFIARHRRLFVLTGAGCSTDSGIPDYRDANGGWKRSPPVNFQSFMGGELVRQRYWARSFVGWQRFRRAGPNAEAVLACCMDGGTVPALCYNLLVEPRADERNPDYAARLQKVLRELNFPAEYVNSI